MTVVNEKAGHSVSGNKAQSLRGHKLPEIIYIMGTGRSGTTILEIMLSNNPHMFGVGEVTHIFKDGYMNNVTCSCGLPASNCEHWSKVKQFCQWQDSETSSLNKLFLDFSWHSYFPIVATGLFGAEKKRAFRETNECLFRSSALISNASTIVDSSKYAGRALQLARAFPDNVRIICLTRSPEGLIKAFRKTDAEEQKEKSLFGIFAYYIYTMTCFRVVAWLLGPQVFRIRYEELVSNPTRSLGTVAAWAGLDLSNSRKMIADNQLLDVGHIVTGNRLRRKGRVKFVPNDKPPVIEGFLERQFTLAMRLYRSLLGF